MRHETLDRFVADVAEKQYGVISLAQAIALGMTASAVKRRVAAGMWIAVFPGVYRLRGAPESYRQRLMAATLWAGGGAVVSHSSAALLWGLDGAPRPRLEVTVPRQRSPRSRVVVVHRTLALPEVDRTERNGIAVTTAARTVIDLAGCLDDEALLDAAESGFRQGYYRASFLSWRLDELGGTGRSGSRRLRDLLEERGEGAAALQYRLEVKTWRLLTKHGLRPQRQFPVKVEGKHYYLDFAWPDHRVAVECEGFDPHGRRPAFVRDRDRLGDLVAIDWRIFPATWDAVTKRPQSLLGKVLRALDSGSLPRR